MHAIVYFIFLCRAKVAAPKQLRRDFPGNSETFLKKLVVDILFLFTCKHLFILYRPGSLDLIHIYIYIIYIYIYIYYLLSHTDFGIGKEGRLVGDGGVWEEVWGGGTYYIYIYGYIILFMYIDACVQILKICGLTLMKCFC